jgi:uncharacterized membrane protein
VNWTDIFNSLPGQAIYGMLALAFVDFILGALAAFRDKTFQLDAVASFLRSQIAGRVLPATVLILGGIAVHQDLLTTAGYGLAVIYSAETLGSILASWGPKNTTILGVQRTTQPVPQA